MASYIVFDRLLELITYNVFHLHRWFCKNKEPSADGKEKARTVAMIVCYIILAVFSLAIISFLFLQILNCYQWTCLFSEQFCGDNRDPYRLSLVQSIISIFFTLSVFAAQYFSSKADLEKPNSTVFYPGIKENCCKWP